MRPRRSRATASRDGERTALLRAIRFVAERRRGVLFLLAALSFVSGLVEAAFLVMVSQIAFSLVDESRSLSLLGLGNVSLSVAIAIAERVKGDETTSYADWMSASRLGSLIHATSGSFGGVGG